MYMEPVRVAAFARATQVMKRASCGEQRVHNAFGISLPSASKMAGFEHQMPYVAHEHEAPTGQAEAAAG